MSKAEPARLTVRIAACRKAISTLPPILTPQAASLAINQVQQELGEIFQWSVDLENFVATFEKQIAALNDAVQELLDERDQPAQPPAPSIQPFDAIQAVNELLGAKAG